MEGDRYTNLFVSDLHCGSIYFDVLAFKKVLNEIRRFKLKADNFHLMGDLIDGKLNYQGQYFETMPVDHQLSVLSYVVKRMIEVVEPRRVFILPGNHDRKYSLNFLDSFMVKYGEELKKLGVELVYYRDHDFYVMRGGDVMVLHGITRSAGSDYTGLTPLVMNNLLGLVKVYGYNGIRYIVVGHYHRYCDIYYQGVRFIAVPGFQYMSKPLREVRGVIFMDGDGRTFPVLVQPSKREEIIDYWREKVRKIVEKELEE